jgi:hypothetical protein
MQYDEEMIKNKIINEILYLVCHKSLSLVDDCGILDDLLTSISPS